jgi:hypothetical protein
MWYCLYVFIEQKKVQIYLEKPLICTGYFGNMTLSATRVVRLADCAGKVGRMANICENRLEVSFVNSEAEAAWMSKHVSVEHGKRWLDTTVRPTDSLVEVQQSFAKITDEDRGDAGSLVLYCDSRWAPPCCFFAEMVKSNASITEASLEYSEPNMCFIGSIEWEKSTNTLIETYREGSDLTDDDWFILGHDKCEDCDQFLCQC